MNDLSIHFQCDFEKIKQATDLSEAVLIQMLYVDGAALTSDFLAYDTDGGAYVLDKAERYLLLIFRGEKGIFTTLRKNNAENHDIYESAIGKTFQLTFNQI